MNLAALTRQQYNGHFGLHVDGDNSKDQINFKLADMQKEIHRLQMVLQQMQHASRRGDGSVSKELPAMQGWVLSIVESYFGIVWAELGYQQMNEVIKEWKHLLRGY